MKKISIYMPTKNRVDLLTAAVNSVLRQTYQNFELVIVDDGSEDQTHNYLQSVSSNDARIKFLRNDKSCGPQLARNRAIEASTGEFLTGLDDDDEFHQDRLECLLAGWSFYEKYSAKVSGVYSQDIRISDGIELLQTKKKGSVGFDDFPYGNDIGNQLFAPRKHFLEVGMFDLSMPAWQDMDLFIRITKKFGPAKLVDLPLYQFNVSTGRVRISFSEEKLRNAFEQICENHYPGRPMDHKKFLMRLFTDYGFKPVAADFVKINRGGVWPRGIYTLLKARFRN